MRNRLQILAILFLSFFMLPACEDQQQSNREATVDVRKVMATRKQAIESKDIELYKSIILPEYNDGKSGYQEQVAYMQSLFDRYNKLEFTYQKSRVDLKMNSARMVGKVSYKADDAEKAVWDQETTLFRRIGEKWYISGGINLGVL